MEILAIRLLLVVIFDHFMEKVVRPNMCKGKKQHYFGTSIQILSIYFMPSCRWVCFFSIILLLKESCGYDIILGTLI